jgi:hypothetical protein
VDEAGGQTQGVGPPTWGFVFHATPPEGIDVTLRVCGEGPLPLRVVAYRREAPRKSPS